MSRPKQKIKVTSDESIIGKDGKILFFSLERFKRDIVEGDCCFICGCSPEGNFFNDEHVIPDWLLREFELQNDQITLPNTFGFKYSKYKVPCCASCNTLLGKQFETPISNLLKRGYGAVCDHLKQNGPWLFYFWLSLIFFKTHLKDRSLRLALDKRKGTDKIADIYDWSTMHHIHCVVRSVYTKIPIDSVVMGSFFLLPAKMANYIRPFDYGDFFFTKTIFLRCNEMVFFCAIDDACATYTLMKDKALARITGPLSPIQIRETMARMSYANSLFFPRPQFFTILKDGFPIITANIPEFVETEKEDAARLGAMMYHLCAEDVKKWKIENKDYILENLKLGKWTFTFYENGDFIKD
jgi:hypothetical protein